jgi:hypothetical protein
LKTVLFEDGGAHWSMGPFATDSSAIQAGGESGVERVGPPSPESLSTSRRSREASNYNILLKS